jgi:hypothetical protein
MGVNPRATQSGKFWLSTPAENEIGTSGRALRYFSTRFSVMTCSGCPDRYWTASVEGKNRRWFRTTSVFENFTWKRRPRERASSDRRSVISRAWPHCRSLSKSSWRVTTSSYPRVSWSRPSTASRPRSVGFSLTVTWTPISVSRKRTMPSISPAGQPWNVESVIWSERAVA